MNPKISKELKRIASRHEGILRAEDVVEAARPKSSPLHSCFEWDDSIAAARYRIHTARNLIAIHVEIVPNTDKKERVWVSLRSSRSKGGGYHKITTVLSQKALRTQLLNDALKELEYFEAKYSRLTELAAVFRAAKAVRQSISLEEAA